MHWCLNLFFRDLFFSYKMNVHFVLLSSKMLHWTSRTWRKGGRSMGEACFTCMHNNINLWAFLPLTFFLARNIGFDMSMHIYHSCCWIISFLHLWVLPYQEVPRWSSWNLMGTYEWDPRRQSHIVWAIGWQILYDPSRMFLLSALFCC